MPPPKRLIHDERIRPATTSGYLEFDHFQDEPAPRMAQTHGDPERLTQLCKAPRPPSQASARPSFEVMHTRKRGRDGVGFSPDLG